MKTHTNPSDDRSASGIDRATLEASQRALTKAAADLAEFCEHIEHIEPNWVDKAARAGDHLREIAAQLSAHSGLSLASAYAERIRSVEERSLMRHVSLFDDATELPGAAALSDAKGWDEIQIGQIIHDRQFHPDVFGLSKIEQVRHYTFHVTKLAGLLVEAIESGDWASFRQERLADIAIFGVKIATVCNVQLAREAVDS